MINAPLEDDEQMAFVQWCQINGIRGEHWVKPRYQHMDDYLINEYGDLISFRRKRPYLMKRHLYKIGYQYYVIQVGKKSKKVKVHRLVAKTFLKDIRGKDIVNHKDGDKTNNHISNLEWCTNSENLIHAFRTLGSYHAGKPKKKVMCIETKEVFDSISAAAIAKKTFRSAIRKVIDGKQSVAGGYTWQEV